MQSMKSPSRRVHVFGGSHVVEHSQLESQPRRVLSLNPRHRAGAEELLHAFVREALDHKISVSLSDT
jgi:hypothetical protein